MTVRFLLVFGAVKKIKNCFVILKLCITNPGQLLCMISTFSSLICLVFSVER